MPTEAVRCAVYVRVSTRDQRYLQQFKEVRAAVEARGWRVVRVYRERRSGAHGANRPVWAALRRDAALRRFGAVAVWSLDRMGRSALEILKDVEAFDSRGVRLVVVRGGVETTGPAGRLVLTVLAAVAELERELISDRTRAGMQAARARGARVGRPRAAVPAAALRAVRNGTWTIRSAAREAGVSPATIRRRLQARS